MSHERQRVVEAIFQEILDLPSEARQERLDRLCGGDQELRRRVGELLWHYEAASPRFLEPPGRAGDDD